MVSARAGAKRADELLTEQQKQMIERDTIEAGCKIALSKGSTEFGIGMAASELIQAILGDEHKVLMCSVNPEGTYGQSGCFVSIPCVVSESGAKPLPEMELTEEEKTGFENSCALMRRMIEEKID
ncbi:MAG: hypothetical protein QM793_00260 [Muricomes sp.]